ncbi:MAG: hypothetical protein ACQEW2_02465 [Bacillota bacterium]|uniref:hypothetical protein n=1 Tax=Cytobacillus firmus TaxID=1399 RepID=UPI00237A979B|nr:hypothetical protein [Cytobacillus firmus]MDD9312624.1 hypothetical protein [Cytobacillus firmus]
MAQASPTRRSVNYDIFKIIKNYFKESSKQEIRFDLLVPFCISSIIVFFLYLSKVNMLDILKEINDVIISVMSILAGFNTASVAIIASSNPLGVVEAMENQGDHIEGQRLLNSLTSYFSYAIILQLFILIVSIIAAITLKFFDMSTIADNKYLFISLSLIFIIWFTLVLNSLLITLRNASILHNFILFLAKR